ncbi:MAG: uroporphyrinogen-III C-methyltransferase, partial [Burkholderiaceae bacterium]
TTGRGEPDDIALPGCDTLIQYMGGQEAIDTARRLIAHGKSPDTPVIAIENVSRDDERVIRLSLAAMVQGLPTSDGPVLVMIGEALRARTDL